jgi:hypothetical protein
VGDKVALEQVFFEYILPFPLPIFIPPISPQITIAYHPGLVQ